MEIEVPYRTVHGLRKVVSFHVDHYWKGSGPAEIKIALFQPTEGAWGWSWFFPARENLLLALNQDATGSGAYRLVHQTNSWLVLRGGTETVESSPEKQIVRVAQEYAEAYTAGTEEKKSVLLMEPVRVGALLSGETCIDNNAVIGQTLATLGEFQVDDATTMAMLENLLKIPLSSSSVQDEAIRALMKIAPKEGWDFGYELYESKSTGQQEALVLSMALPEGDNDGKLFRCSTRPRSKN